MRSDFGPKDELTEAELKEHAYDIVLTYMKDEARQEQEWNKSGWQEAHTSETKRACERGPGPYGALCTL